MTAASNPDNKTAMQYLVWALEEIEKTGNEKAAQHARSALAALQEASLPVN